jgi:uncharacterized membrane protein YobD (UPF0266 family)
MNLGSMQGIDNANPATTLGMQILSRRKSASVIFLHHIPLTSYRQKSLNRSAAISVYLTVLLILR